MVQWYSQDDTTVPRVGVQMRNSRAPTTSSPNPALAHRLESASRGPRRHRVSHAAAGAVVQLDSD